MPYGAADSLLLAALAQDYAGKLLTVICTNPADAQRLADEIAFFAPDCAAHVLPDWETLPYDAFSPHRDLVSERLATLYSVTQANTRVLLVPATTALYRLAPPSYLASHTFFFRQGDKLDIEKLRTQLTVAGYACVSQVMAPGEYAVRGSLVDLYPTGSSLPYRLDLFGDDIESIKTFDPDSQRSLYPVKDIRILPGHEFPLTEEARALFRGRWREVFEGDPSKCSVYKDIGNGIPAAGIEYYLPLFFEQTATLFDYLPTDTLLVTHGNLEETIRPFWTDAESRHRFASADSSRPVLAPSELFLSAEQFFVQAQPYARLALTNQPNGEATAPPNVAIQRRAEDPVQALRDALSQSLGHKGMRTLILAESAGRRETVRQTLAEYGLVLPTADTLADFSHSDSPAMLGVGPLLNGFRLAQITVLTENELYSSQSRRKSGKRGQEGRSNIDSMVRDLAELRIGDPVVHEQHGIGRYLGLISMDMGDGDSEFLQLEYAHNTQLYVPVANLHLISRYSGSSPDEAPLHQLGSGQWEKARKKAAQQARDTAAELLNLYARRAARPGHSFGFEAKEYEEFVEGFGFEETPDQLAAIHAVIQDMVAAKPMDRLVCGDVGFGKTEVALRAAFVAVMGGKQVAVLAPTTLLAEQHYQTFVDRFANFPVRLAELSRFRTSKEVNAAIAALNTGELDIVIGTHKLLSPSVQFARLGLVIIDEEHRFGVRQKEALKNLRSEVDVLTLTATPIPRTLGMALEGLRDLSVIATAPQKRLAIKTFVRRESEATIREAMLRELKRGGQVYFLHNEVETIENRRERLQALVPEARIAVAHGQMGERELERVMRDFYQQRYNILLCTTIIETGIDVPTANTIIMHRADKFGLAQLHQLRGRVGRSHHQAYAYLLIHSEEALTKQAQLRLQAIQDMEELGSGFYLAMHDLEIRGCGEVLGDNQSGNMQEVGFQMYADMLNLAVKALKNGKEPDLLAPLHATTEIKLHTPALLPNDYCPDVHERLSLYKRLASATDTDNLNALQEELIDRFGPLPSASQALMETHRLRLLAEQFAVQKIDASAELITLSFTKQARIDPAKVILLIQKQRHISFQGQDKLRIALKPPQTELSARSTTIRQILREIQDDASAT
ncbi:transcription-repair coupling factor [Parvibium lacunae]|uniref:Transcription-repair-coupling factor n=1 Tax=Parvibium lacunae TaxID=1888893 RepID=A0A368L9M5_9BURK|nr:transcription-repair coupling factor [Parvibium lacunae]